MTNYTIKCVAVDVRTESGICPGSAKCQKGETYMLTARTPEPAGICGRAFATMHPMAFAMRWTEEMPWEKTDYVNVVCPDGFVTYRLLRIREQG
jgi:uncharacterized repeat protein (TIGR04076 family)